jgi:hypothetical protein
MSRPRLKGLYTADDPKSILMGWGSMFEQVSPQALTCKSEIMVMATMAMIKRVEEINLKVTIAACTSQEFYSTRAEWKKRWLHWCCAASQKFPARLNQARQINFNSLHSLTTVSFALIDMI